MLVDVNKVLTAMNGNPLKDIDGEGNAIDVLLKIVITNAVLAPASKQEAGVDKLKKYELAKKIYMADSPVELSDDEVKLIKDRVGETLPPLIVGQVFEMLEG